MIVWEHHCSSDDPSGANQPSFSCRSPVMDHFNKKSQNSRQRHAYKPASGVGQSGSKSVPPTTNIISPGMSWNMAGTAASSYGKKPNQQPPLKSNFGRSFSDDRHGYGPSAAGGVGQTMPNQRSSSQPHGYSTDRAGASATGFHQTMASRNSNTSFSRYGISDMSDGSNENYGQPTIAWIANKSLDSPSVSGLSGPQNGRRKVLLPTPTQKVDSMVDTSALRGTPFAPGGSPFGENSSASSQFGGNGSALNSSRASGFAPGASQCGGSRSMLEASRFRGTFRGNGDRADRSASDTGRFGGDGLWGGDRSALSNSRCGANGSASINGQYGANSSASISGQYGENLPVLDARRFEGNRPVPDGACNLKYPTPDVKNLLFDSSTGYRFDPTTGLHYDANSGFYLNRKLKVLLRWDPLSSTYVLVSDNTSDLAPPAVKLLTETPSSRLGGLSREDLKDLARELAPLLKSESHEPNGYLNYDSSGRSDLDHDEYNIRRRTDEGMTGSHPSAPKRRRWVSLERPKSVELDLQDRRGLTSGSYCSPPPEHSHQRRDNDQYAVTERTWDERRDPNPFGRRSLPTASQPVSLCDDPGPTIMEIHERNSKDHRNLYGRYFPEYSSPSTYILVAPVPSSEEMSKMRVFRRLESALSSDGLAFRSIRVFQADSSAPCNYALIRFNNEESASYWYKSRRGTLLLGHPRNGISSFLFFAENTWLCSKRRGDKGCDTPTPNFPYRTLCYKCFEHRTKLESPVVKRESPSKWVGISQLDCVKCASVTDVLNTLPSYRGITIESMEFLREPSGLPLGLCVFQTLNAQESARFFDTLKAAGFNVSHVDVDKRALDFLNAPSNETRRKTVNRRIGPRDASWSSAGKTAVPAKERLGHPAGGAKKTKPRNPDPCEEYLGSIAEKLGGNFTVVDEYTEGDGEDQNTTSEPFLRPKPLRQLMADQLKNAVSLHATNSSDPNNVLRDLFVDPPVLGAIVLLGPIPDVDKDSTKNEIQKILTADCAGFQNVGVFQGKVFGAPCDYGLVKFNKPYDALSWYNKHSGVLNLSGGARDQRSAFMYFSEDNWTCCRCKLANFALRTWCNKCFLNRNELDFSVVSESRVPTQFLGISSVGLPIDVPESGFTTDKILESLPATESARIVSCEMMLEGKGLPGLCVLKTENAEDCEDLQKQLLSKGWRGVFLQMQCEPLILAQKKVSDTSNTSTILHSDQRKINADLYPLKIDMLKHIYDNSKPSQHIIMSPAPSISWKILNPQVHKVLTEDGVVGSCSYDACRPEFVGSPHDYIQVTFADLEKAVSWYDRRNGHFELEIPETPKQQDLKFRMQMFYSEKPWSCRTCLCRNFPARSLCHKCYTHRDDDAVGPVTISNEPTRWVGISNLRKTVYNVVQVKRLLPPLDAFTITRMHVVKEPNPLLHVGLCVIQTPTTCHAVDLAQCIQKYDRKLKVIYVNVNHLPEEICEEQKPEIIHSTSLSISSDAVFCHTPASDKLRLWWRNMSKGDDGDVLKNLFQDQPSPAGGTVFVPIPLDKIVISDQNRVSLLTEAGVDKEVAANAKLYKGNNVGGPCSYFIVKFDDGSAADAWRAKHDGKWVMHLEDGTPWTSFLHPTASNWTCEKCTLPNFPLRGCCFRCYVPREGGTPVVTVSEDPTRFVGVSKFQNWCATEEILLDNIKTFTTMKANQQLKKVHYPTEPSGIPLGLCVLEFENIAVARRIFVELIALTQKRHDVVYVEGSSLHWD